MKRAIKTIGSRAGFTLVEVLVALALFAIVSSIATGAFLRSIRAQQEASELISVHSNADLALDEMARNIRTGSSFCTTQTSTLNNDANSPSNGCTADECSTFDGQSGWWSCSLLSFNSADGSNVQYALKNGAVTEANKNSNSLQPMTSDNVSVKYLQFIVHGQFSHDGWNPRITIVMGVAPSSTDQSIANDVLNLQTTINAYSCGIPGYGC